MTTEIRDVRAKWQSYRQALMRADYNQADEQLARAMYFADHNPLIAGILNRLRSTSIYQQFNANEWLSGRRDADVMGAGNTSLGFSLDEDERTAQNLRVLEMAVQKGDDALWGIGTKTFGGGSTKLIDYVRSAVEVLFDPFYQYVDAELRSMESLISPMDIMNQIQSLVDNTTSTQYPQTHKLLTDAYRQLFSLTAASTGVTWNKVGYSCRDILLQFANEIFDPTYITKGQELPKGDDAKVKLKWTVRHFLKQDGAGDRYREAIESVVQANWDFVNSVGHRQKSATEGDARLSVVYTYLTISILDDVLKGASEQQV
jgi:hypothetical protein